MELPYSIQRQVDNYESIEVNGLTLHPILVRDYDLFILARPALEVMHQSLPVAMMRIPLLSALYKMDYEARISGKPETGLFWRSVLALALSMRLMDGESVDKRLNAFRVVVDREDPSKLTRLEFTDVHGEHREITPPQYRELRLIVAAQNGVTVEDEKANPEIVRLRKAASSGGAVLDYDINSLKNFASVTGRVNKREIDGWPILRLSDYADTMQRALAYLVCGIGEASGASWRGGNPFPHPIFKRVDNGNGLFSVFDNGENTQAGVVKQDVSRMEAIIKNNSQ